MILKNAKCLIGKDLVKKDIEIIDGIITKISDKIDADGLDLKGLTILPSFIDPHVHLREPGFEYKSTILEGSKSCAKGGYTDVFMMPNLNPTPSSKESIKPLLEAQKTGVIRCHILGSITKNEASIELSDFDDIDKYCLGYSDDGKGVKTSKLMYEAMLKVKKLNKHIIAHVEDESLLYGGCIKKGKFSEENNLKGILGISETAQLARDLVLAKETQVKYHMCHMSTKNSLELMNFYKDKANVTCEVCPHHLLLCENDLVDSGDFKMNPPLAGYDDMMALREALKKGQIDCIATDHAPHSNEEKSRGLEKSAFGIVGIEDAFSLMYTNFVLTNDISLYDLICMMSLNPSRIFNLDSHEIKVGNKANLTIVDLDGKYTISKDRLISRATSMPFSGYEVNGIIKYTIMDGQIVFEKLQ